MTLLSQIRKYLGRQSGDSNSNLSSGYTLEDVSPSSSPTVAKYADYAFESNMLSDPMDDLSSCDDHDSSIHGRDDLFNQSQQTDSSSHRDQSIYSILKQYAQYSEKAKFRRTYGSFSEVTPLLGHTDVVTKVIKIDNERVLSISDDATLIIWRVPIALPLKLIGHERRVTCAIVLYVNMQDGTFRTLIASGSSDKSVRVWDADSGICIFTETAHTSGVNIMCDLGENLFCSIGEEICVWKLVGTVDTPVELVCTIERFEKEHVHSALVLPNRRILISSTFLTMYSTEKDDIEPLILDDTSTSSVVGSCLSQSSPDASSREDIFCIIRITPETFVTACRDGWLSFWSETSLLCIDTLDLEQIFKPNQNKALTRVRKSKLRYVALLNGSFLGCCYGKHFVIINHVTKQPVLIKLKAHDAPINRIEYIPHRNCLVTCSDDSRLKIWKTFMTLSFQSLSQSTKFSTPIIESRRNRRSSSHVVTPFQFRRRSRSVELRPTFETDPNTNATISTEIETLSAHSYSCVDFVRFNDYELVSAGGNDLILWRDEIYATTICQLYSWRFATSVYNKI